MSKFSGGVEDVKCLIYIKHVVKIVYIKLKTNYRIYIITNIIGKSNC